MQGTWAGYSADAAESLRRGSAEDVRAALQAARERTLALARDWQDALAGAAIPCAQELNPPLWELGHVGWFQEWWIARNPQRARGHGADPEAARLASVLPSADGWYDSSRVPHAARWRLPLPDADGTREYLERTLHRTLQLLRDLPAQAGDDALYFFRLAALHEQMHAEAACYMARRLGLPLRERTDAPVFAAAGELVLAGGRFRLGSEGSGFAFDNELQAHEVAIGALAIDAAPLTWLRFLPFVEAGGYRDERWWSEAGRAWLRAQADAGPVALDSATDLRQPALHLTAWEAEAWCRWAGRRLPSEAEWECAALTLPGFAWGGAWEWTASVFQPYPGFVPHPYRDYSAPWFGSRRVLRGAAAATAPTLAHPRYRNFFEPHRRDIYAGFRSCRSLDAAAAAQH